MALPIPLRVLAALVAPGLAWVSLLCVSLSMWDLPGSAGQQLADGAWLLVASCAFGAAAVANVLIASGRRAGSWWLLLGLVPSLMSVISAFTDLV